MKKVFSPPHFSFDYKTSPLSSQGVAFLDCLFKASQVSYYIKSLLIYHFAPNEFFSALRHK